MKATAAAPRIADREGVAPLVTLAAAATAVPEELTAIRRWNEENRMPTKNGFTRSIGGAIRVRVAPESPRGGGVMAASQPELLWGGSVRVEGAYRLRLHLTNVVVPEGTTFWVYGRGGDPIAFGTELIDPNREMYTPSIAGDLVRIEMEVPGNSAGASFDIQDVLELVGPATPVENDLPTCLIDGTCVASATLDVIALYRKAVAHLQYVKNGGGFVCTGGLLNDSDDSSFIPYLLTANHCFSTQASATTLEAFFDYQTLSCNAAFPAIGNADAFGSTLLATNATSDFTFVRLNSAPAGRAYLGWDSTPVSNGAVLHRLSHPFPSAFSQPAPQRYSSTVVTTTSPTCSTRPRPQYLYSIMDDGGVYGGSSGSPVILAGGIVVGQLYGSCGPNDPSAGCDASNFTVDGAFATTFSSISNFIGGSSGGETCTANATTACMLNNRFKVTVRFRNGFDNNPVDTNASVKPVSGFSNPSFETAFFYFNNSNNIEMLIKILDQGNTNTQGQPTIAVLFGSATPLRVELTVTDTLRGGVKVYTSNLGAMAGATDFTAFVK